MKSVIARFALANAISLGAALLASANAADVTVGAAFPMSGDNAEYGQIFSS